MLSFCSFLSLWSFVDLSNIVIPHCPFQPTRAPTPLKPLKMRFVLYQRIPSSQRPSALEFGERLLDIGDTALNPAALIEVAGTWLPQLLVDVLPEIHDLAYQVFLHPLHGRRWLKLLPLEELDVPQEQGFIEL